ncbi:MAG: tRNA lysidine(34) synthetase TilS [Bacteroidales bacterium]|jgi:tRNA(Ile)-lysidine synthase|nr:tRNA lysidine(34) synthetase TilS [Bacteroidales bacterium]
MTLFEEFKDYAARNALFTKDDRILLAVSGGIDSMVMLHLFSRMRADAVIAHCNFRLRGAESDMDEELVRVYAGKDNIPFHSVSFDTRKFAGGKGISIQMAARDLRYEWFEQLRIQQGCSHIAVAHNLNDNIETLLINLTRGTGLTGLAGMKPSANGIIRPLLFATRARIEAWCSEFSVPFREDRSNAETKYTRNKIRHLVIPVMKEINPSIEETLNDTALRLGGLDRILSEHIEGLRSRISVKRGRSIVFDTEKLAEFSANKAMMFELFFPWGITEPLAGDLQKLVNADTGKQIFTLTHRILKNRNELIVSSVRYEHQADLIIESVEDLLSIPSVRFASLYQVDSGYTIPRDPRIASIDREKIRLPLIVRRWKEGDYFVPLGMKNRKKLSDHFVDNKFSRIRKEETMILESDGDIVWVMGERLDDRFRVTDSTRTVLRIEMNDPSE